MKISLVLSILLLFAGGVWGENLTLECKGKVEVSEVGITSFFGENSGSGIFTQEKQKDAFIIFSMDKSEKEGWVQLSNSLLIQDREIRKEKKYDFSELEVTDSIIKAQFQIKRANKPEITINRNTGSIEYISKRYPRRFSGTCEKIEISKRKF